MLLDYSPKSARKQVGGLPASIFSVEVAGETEIISSNLVIEFSLQSWLTNSLKNS